MRILHISDLHIPGPGITPYGIDPAHRFIKALEAMHHLLPIDYIVLNGDLCYRDESREIYRWARERLKAFSVPVFAISGNHDDPALMHEFFSPGNIDVVQKKQFAVPPEKKAPEGSQKAAESSPTVSETGNTEKNAVKQDKEFVFTYRTGRILMIFLDTHRGTMTDEQLSWLSRQIELACRDSLKVLIFMHHPPLEAGVPHMDRKYAFRRPEDFFSAISGNTNCPTHIFCGHYHTEKTIIKEKAAVYITPSTFFEIDQYQDDFAVLDIDPGFRVIDVLGTMIRTSVCRYRT